MKEQIFQKLTSRKFWFALGLFAAGLTVMFGYAENTAEMVTGAVMSVGSAITYILTEGAIDKSRVNEVIQSLMEVLFTLLDSGKEATEEVKQLDEGAVNNG